MSVPVQPVSIKREGPGLAIVWSDGGRSFCAFSKLRTACPCATCNDERAKPPDPFRVLSPREMAQSEPVHPVKMQPCGYYAYQITWSDGHDTGIYTLEHLRALGEPQA